MSRAQYSWSSFNLHQTVPRKKSHFNLWIFVKRSRGQILRWSKRKSLRSRSEGKNWSRKKFSVLSTISFLYLFNLSFHQHWQLGQHFFCNLGKDPLQLGQHFFEIDLCKGDWSEEVALPAADKLPRRRIWRQAHGRLLGERDISGGVIFFFFFFRYIFLDISGVKNNNLFSKRWTHWKITSWARGVWTVNIQLTFSPMAGSTGMCPSE